MTCYIDDLQSRAAIEYLHLWERWLKRERMADLIVKSAVKNALDENNVSADFYEALDDEVTELLEDAARRAEANDRKTVQPRDL